MFGCWLIVALIGWLSVILNTLTWQVLDRCRILVLVDGGHVNSCDLSRVATAFLRLLQTGGLVFRVVCFFLYYCARLLSTTAFFRAKMLNFWTRISLASTFSTSGSHNN